MEETLSDNRKSESEFEIIMARNRHYSPQISRFLVSVLFHQAQALKIPMTKLTDQLLRKALVDTEGWTKAEAQRDPETSPSFLASVQAA